MPNLLASDIPLEEATIGNVLARQASRMGDKPLIVSASTGKTITYRELDSDSNRISHGIAAAGIGRQETVLVLMPDCFDYVRLWCGLAKRGAIEVPINRSYRDQLLAYICNDAQAKTIVVAEQYLGRLEEIADQLEFLEQCIVYADNPTKKGNVELPLVLAERCVAIEFEALFSDNEAVFEPAPTFHELAQIIYTSGTTGPSKGVMMPFAHAFFDSKKFGAVSNYETDDIVYLPGAPLFHLQGRDAIYAGLMAGCTVVHREHYKTQHFWKDVRAHGCTNVQLLGAIGNFLWKQPATSDDANNPMKKVALYPVIPEWKAFAKRFDVQISTAFSSSECPISLAFPLGEPFPHHTCIGFPYDGMQVKIFDENDVEVPTGERGEICLRPSNPWEIMLGYWNRPEATARAFRNLWYHTGDVGYKDEAGRVYFAGRSTDSLRRRGENISAQEVENVITQYRDVLECAVFGVPADDAEDEVMAAIVPINGCEVDPVELTEFLNQKLPYYMVPRYLDFVPSLAKTPSGKVQKPPLRKRGVTDNTWDLVKAGVKLIK